MVNICCKYKTKIIDITVMGGIFFQQFVKKTEKKERTSIGGCKKI